MQASFIIPLYNCLALTQAMLASLRASLPAGFDGEIIFVDDGSTDGTRDWLATLPDSLAVSPVQCRVLLNEKNQGFAATCNRGAAAAAGEFLFFLNNDLVLQLGWLEPILDTFHRFKTVGLIGNVQLDATTGAIDHAGIRFNLKGKPEHDTDRPLLARLTGHRQVPALTGACFAIRSALWRELGGFDEGFVNGAEDVDLCLRAEAAGWRHYVALRSIVRHHISASTGRKLRDEQNSQRLALRWRNVIAAKIARKWCRAHLENYWADPRDFPDPALARAAFFHVLHLRPHAPAGAVALAQQAIEVELARWEKMFSNGS